MSSRSPGSTAAVTAAAPALPAGLGPRPLLDRERERRLTARQRELLDNLELLVADGFDKLTMADIASRLNCSLRTLYELAPSRDELVLVVLDRNLWRIGRDALAAIDATSLDSLGMLRAYLHATNVAAAGWTDAFAQDLAMMPAAQRLVDGHNDCLVGVAKMLLDRAVEDGDVGAGIDTGAVAHAMSSFGRFFFQPHARTSIQISPKDAADQVVDLVLDGLRHSATKGTR